MTPQHKTKHALGVYLDPAIRKELRIRAALGEGRGRISGVVEDALKAHFEKNPRKKDA